MLYGLGILTYIIIVICVGWFAKKRIKSAEDYLVAGRALSLPLNSATLTAAFFGGVIIIGVPGAAYSVGIWNDDYTWGLIAGIGGPVMCLILAGTFFMPKIWRMKLYSIADYFFLRFGNVTGVLATIMLCSSFLLYGAVQIVVFAKVGSSILDWPVLQATLIAVSVICIYTVLGGLWAVSLTDILQVSVLIACVIFVLFGTVHFMGGWEAAVGTIPPEKLQVFPKTAAFAPWLAWIAAWLASGFGSIPSPDLMQRAFSAKSPKVARRSAYTAATILMVVGAMVSLLGFFGAELIQNGTIPESALQNDPELIIPVVVKAMFPVGVVAVFLGACLAAVMSTGASCLLALSSMLYQNVLRRIFFPHSGDQRMVLVTRLTVICMCVLVTIIALNFPYAYVLSVFAFDLTLSTLFVPLALGFFWKKSNGFGATCGIAAGAAVRIIGAGMISGFTLEGITANSEYWYYFTLGGPLASLIFMVIGSLLTQKQYPPKEIVVPEA